MNTLVVLATVVCGIGAEAADPPPLWTPRQPPKAQYTIDASLEQDGDGASLEATETIRLANPGTRPMAFLALDWPLGWAEALQVKVEGSPVTLKPMEKGSSCVSFPLPTLLAPGREVRLDVTFSTTWDTWEEDRIQLLHWYPCVYWGFETHDDYSVSLKIPDGCVVGASGRLDATSGRYVIKGAKSFGMVVARNHRELEAVSGDVTVRAIFPEAAEACARLLVDTAADAIGFYRERFGFYPYSSLTIVPGADDPMGGCPMATALVAIHGQARMGEKPESHWRWIAAHEIGHQYWGEWVLERDSPGWVWIGLGIYADRAYTLSRKLGNVHQRELMDKYLGGVAKDLDTTLAITPEKHAKISFDYNNICTHGKGFSVISALACVLGHETFLKIEKRCLKDFAGRRMGAYDFQTVCEEESGMGLDWFFDQWVRSNKRLAYQVTSKDSKESQGKYVSRVEVTRMGTLSMPVPVQAVFGDGSKQTKFTGGALEREEVLFESTAALQDAVIDADGELAMSGEAAETSQGGFSSSEEVTIAKLIARLPLTGVGVEALALFFEAEDQPPEDTQSWYKLGLALYDGKNYPEAQKAFQHVIDLDKTGKSLEGFAARVMQGMILDIAERRDEAVTKYNEALSADPGKPMAVSQYGIQIDRAWVEERLKTPFARP